MQATAAGLAASGLYRKVLAAASPRPNIILIVADDLGIGELGCYGQKRIRTPNIDRMAAEGLRFTQAYCGTSVCAPSRCALLTGLHMGHAPIRANREVQPEGQKPLPPGMLTVAGLLKQAGYATACIGKWGLGMFDTTGSPLKNGFDHFFGYNCQRHAHSYFPKYLYRDERRFDLDGRTYAQDLIASETLDWVKANRDRPFFLFYAITLPHGKYEIPSTEPYSRENWPEIEKIYAAMITRLDSDVGRLMQQVKDLGLDERTLVLFTSDNGPAENNGGHTTEFFDSNGPYRGTKRTLYEGGLRVPMIARWPQHVPAGRTSDAVWAFWDILPTCAELAGVPVPQAANIDGVSVVPALLGGPGPQREYLYWELHEGRTQQAVRFGDYKAVKDSPSAAVEIYDLERDVTESHDIASERPDLVKRAVALMSAARIDSPDWPMRERRPATRPATRKA